MSVVLRWMLGRRAGVLRRGQVVEPFSGQCQDAPRLQGRISSLPPAPPTGCDRQIEGRCSNSTRCIGQMHVHGRYAGFVLENASTFLPNTPENTLPVGSFWKTNPPAKTLCKRHKYL